MKNNYKVVDARICAFCRTKNGGYFDQNDFSANKICVADLKNNYVIDIMQGLKYDYIKSINGIYLFPGEADKVEDGKRYAIVSTLNYDLNKKDQKRVKAIIELLKEGQNFQNGNDVLTNEEFYNEDIKITKKVLKRKKI